MHKTTACLKKKKEDYFVEANNVAEYKADTQSERETQCHRGETLNEPNKHGFSKTNLRLVFAQ